MDIRLPKLGEGADSGTVVNIMVKPGDRIEAGQNLIELENEKAVAPIPSPAAGTIADVRVKEGDKISIGQVIVTLTPTTAGASATPPVLATAPATIPSAPAAEIEAPVEEPVGPEEPMTTTSALSPAASPSLRRMARELGIDLTRVRGSEKGGRIVLGDLRAYIQRLQRAAFGPKPVAPAAKATTPPAEKIDFGKWGPIERKPLSPLRQTISRRMSESWSTVPRVTQFDDADITALNDLRKKYSPAYEERGTKLTVSSFAVRAVVATLKNHPFFNASFDESAQEIVFKHYYHIGMAVDTEHGLIVPVIRDCDKKSLLELSIEIAALGQKARERKVTADELQGGTFTFSNQGAMGGAHFTPIVAKPQLAILGMGRAALKPVVRDDRIEPRLMLPLALSYDHRLIDGANAARFIVELVKNLETIAEDEVKLVG